MAPLKALKRIFRNKVSKWYHRYCEADLVGMTLMQLGYFNDPKLLDSMTPKEKDDFFSQCKDLEENEAFKHIMDEVVSQIKEGIFLRSNDSQIIFDRFTINGVYLIKEKVEYYATLTKGLEDKYDKYDLI